MSATCCALWIGDSLGAVERACLRSVLRHGHLLHLYCYEEPKDVPDGVELRDAGTILPRESVIRHRTGSVALFSNRFRYELQRLGHGTWLDCDIYLLTPLDQDAPYLFGAAPPPPNASYPKLIYTGILPANSPLLSPLLALFDEREVPPWLSRRARLAARLRLWRTGRAGLSRMPWGSAGPFAFTALAEAHGLAHWALPAEAFYPSTGPRRTGFLIRAAGLRTWSRREPRPSSVERVHQGLQGHACGAGKLPGAIAG